MHAVAVSVNILIPRWYWARLELDNGFCEGQRFSGVYPCLVKSEMWRIGKLRGSNEREVCVRGKVVGVGRDCVKVVYDFRRSGCCKPTNKKAYIVYASFGGFAICFW